MRIIQPQTRTCKQNIVFCGSKPSLFLIGSSPMMLVVCLFFFMILLYSRHLLITFFVYLVIYKLYLIYFIRMDEGRQPLSRKLPIPSSKINPYRMIIILRLVILGLFFHYRILHPVNNAYGLWLTSVICEIWFAISWILDQFPKWHPIKRETYLDRLSLR